MAVRILRSLFNRHDPGLPLENFGRTGVVVSLFLTPLVLLPWTADAWEIHKLAVLLLGVVVGWIGWFGAAMRRRKIAWEWTSLDWIVVAVVGITLLSTWFSVDQWMSWIGNVGAMAGTMTMTLVGASIYFLSSRLADTPSTRSIWWAAFGGGILTSLLLQIFQLSGVSLLPSVFSNAQLLTTISNNGLDITLLAAALGTAAVLAASQAQARWQQLASIAGLCVAVLVLVFFAQALGWAVFAFGMIGVVLLQSQRGSKMNNRWVTLAVAIAAAGMIFQLAGVANYSSVTRPVDVRLDTASTNAITTKTVSQRPLLGSGPATWLHDFVANRPVSFNASPYWSNRFVRSRTAWSEVTASLGLMGLVAWISLLGLGLLLAWRRWRLQPGIAPTMLVFGLAGTAVIGLFAPWSLVWITGVWMLLGLVRSEMGNPKLRPIGPGLPLSLAIFGLVAAGMGYYAFQIYSSEILTQRAQQAIFSERPIQEVRPVLESAFNKNTHSLAAASLLSTVQAAEAELAARENQTEQATAAIQAAVATMETMLQRNPRHPVAYEEANNLLNRLSGLTTDAEERARQYFTVLRKLEPTNPIHDVGFGQTAMITRAKLLSATTVTEETKQQAQQLFDSAIKAYGQALQKKPDYLQARFARAHAYAVIEDYATALKDLEAVKTLANDLPSFWEQYGTVLSKLARNGEAVVALERAITLEPQTPSGYLTLAEHYQATNDVTQAKAVLGRGLKAIPDDQSLQDALDALSA